MRSYIEEDLENSMPVMCDCGNIFDLQEGYKSLSSSKVVCEQCFEREEKQTELELELNELHNQIEDAKMEITDCQERIEEINKELKKI